MRILFGLKCGLLLVSMLSVTGFAFGCNRLSAGQSLWVRLTAPVSSYTAKVGDPVHAVVTEDLVCDKKIVLPMGSPIEGVVRSKRKVGWGVRHETAALELEFDHSTIEPNTILEFNARVEEVENAREPVRKGVVQGIRSSDTFQGSINSRLIHLPTWNPYSDPVLIVYKALFPIFPEPEIYFPAGTDLHLRTTSEISLPPVAEASREATPIVEENPEQLERLVGQLPWRVTTHKNVDADLINIAFLGSQDVVKSAFRAAGWSNADLVSTHSVMKNLYSLLNKSSYVRQPMMTFYLNGRPEDMNWQKGFDSYDRRDHLRIWQWTTADAAEPVWISSSTRDTGATLALKQRRFVHHIAPEIDEERSTIIRDLNFAGCVSSVSYISRPEVPATTHNAIGDVMHTDGSIAIVSLKECQPVAKLKSDGESQGFKAGNHAFRFVRRQILTFHSDILRANIIYASYDVGRRAWMAVRH